MAQRIVLHIGAMKTGTTYVQSILRDNAPELAASGVLPGRVLGRPSGAVAKVLARPSSAKAAEPWKLLIDQARCTAHETVVISTEFLSFARPHQIAALLAPMAGLEVDVALVARDQSRAIASQWQTYCRNFGEDRWPDYVRRIDPRRQGVPTSKAWRTYYRGQDLARMVTDWSRASGVNQMHVLCPPASSAGSPATLWQTFAAATRIAEAPVREPVGRINPSVGHASAQMLQDLGQHWKQAGVPVSQVRIAMRPLIGAALVPRRETESAPVLDRAAWDFAEHRNAHHRDAIERAQRTGPVLVHGDIATLSAPMPRTVLPRRASDIGRADVRSAASALWTEAGRSHSSTMGRPWTYRGLLQQITTLVRAGMTESA